MYIQSFLFPLVLKFCPASVESVLYSLITLAITKNKYPSDTKVIVPSPLSQFFLCNLFYVVLEIIVN